MRISDWSSDVCSSDLLDGRLQRRRIRQVDEAELQPGRAAPDVLEQPVGAAVEVVHGDHVVAGVQQLQQRAHGGEAAGEGEAGGTVLQIGDAGLQCEARGVLAARSEEHTSELQSLMRISYAVFCLKKKTI